MFTTSFKATRVYNGGSALANDNDPNTTAPAAERVFEMPPIPSTGGVVISAFGGTSTTCRPWIYDPVSGKWLATTATVNTVASGQGNTISVGPSVKKVFIQIVANTGVTELFYGAL